MFKKSLDVYWSPYGGNGEHTERIEYMRCMSNILWIEPQPLLKHVVEERNKDVLYLKCPAFTSVYKNTFVIKSPVDIEFIIAPDATGSKKVYTTNDTSDMHLDFFTNRNEDENNVFKMMSFTISYLFYAKETVEMEIYPPVLSQHTSETLRNISVICGKFDISKWIRPVDFAFEIIDDFKPLVFKRGDPLFYIRFNTEKSVNLKRIELNDDIIKLASTSIRLKKYFPFNSLKQNYEFAKPLINLYNKSLFKKKCPFKF
jgi:hypothetical protein